MRLAPDEALTMFSPTLEAFNQRVLAHASDPESWHRYRRGGVTATFIRDVMIQIDRFGRDWDDARKRVEADRARPFAGNQYTDWGNLREPVLMDWVRRKFSIEASDALVHHPDVPLHLATPDGVGVDYDDRLRLAEVKTSKHGLHPGGVGEDHVLRMAVGPDGSLSPVVPDRKFWATGYYDQMQWQMHVAGADKTLFVWEQHNDEWPIPTPLYMEPEYCWVVRDQRRIDQMVEVANWYLANKEDLAASDEELAADYEQLTEEYVAALERAKHWADKAEAVKAQIADRIGDVDSFTVETSVAKVTRSTSNPKPTFDEALWARKAPAAYAGYLRARERYTKQPAGVRSLRITPKKKVEGE